MLRLVFLLTFIAAISDEIEVGAFLQFDVVVIHVSCYAS